LLSSLPVVLGLALLHQVLVTFESNWQRAKEILQKIVDDRSTHLTDAAMDSVRKASQSQMII
jgi:hypothetical protein